MMSCWFFVKRITFVSSFVIAVPLILTPVIASEKKDEFPARLLEYSAKKYKPQEIEIMAQPSANPWLSFLPVGTEVDWNYWRTKNRVEAKKKVAAFSNSVSQKMSVGTSRFPVTPLPNFGARPWQDNSLEISGEFSLPTPVVLIPSPEDEGSIPLATETGLSPGNAVVVDAEIGDGPFGSGGTQSGDFDFYVIRGVEAGQTITVDLDTPEPFGPLDPYVEVYNSEGVFIGANDDGDPSSSYDSFLTLVAPEDGDYFVSIAAFGTFALNDPFDSSSGPGNIFNLPLDEGIYTATIGLDYFDEKTFAFVMLPGDVFGASIDGTAAKLSIVDRTRTERQGSMQDLRFIMPDNSPLPGGLVSVNHVADILGLFRFNVQGMTAGAFTLQLEAALPTLRTGMESDVQTIFIDFDGATVDLSESIFPDAPPGQIIAELSPLSAFLEGWGLAASDEDAVIDSIMSVVWRSLVGDVRRFGRNRDFRIRLLNSRDHRDPFGMENVSRVIVGGTIDELGVSTIGIAQSIDVGNFDTSETAFVLLDLLSDPNELNPNSLNSFPRAADSSIIELIGVGVGEITAHEAGHYLGNWHTDQFNDQPNIMDQGGNIAFSIIGIGEDGVFGTEDDVDVMFGRDEFVPSEGLTGIENTLTTIAWGATQPEEDDDDEEEED